MPDDKPLTTEEALKKLIKETDRAVAKAQAAMAMVVGRANPEPKATPTVGEPRGGSAVGRIILP